jgi:hypothetical protein
MSVIKVYTLFQDMCLPASLDMSECRVVEQSNDIQVHDSVRE